MIGLRETRKGVRPKTLQKGFREYLCCANCEKLFNDRYEKPCEATWATLVSRKAQGGISIEQHRTRNGTIYFQLTGFSFDTFKLFLLLQLWRAGVSSKPEYSAVSLGPHEDVIRQMLEAGDPGDQYTYPCTVILVEGGLSVLTPFVRLRYESHITYQIVIEGVMLWYFVSSHARTKPMTGVSLSDDSLDAVVIPANELELYRRTLAVAKNAKQAENPR